MSNMDIRNESAGNASAGPKESRFFLYFAARRKAAYFMLTLLIVSLCSFAVGYLANRETTRVPIIIEKCSEKN